MGNYCARSEPDDAVTTVKFAIGKDYQELSDQTVGEGVKKTNAWKATITRQQLESKREEFWQTRTSGRRNIWLAIKNAIEADHATAALLLQMSGIAIKGENLTVLEDTNGNVYEVPCFMINDPLCFSNEIKKRVPKQVIAENVEITVKVRRPGFADDETFQINNLKTGEDLKRVYAEKVGVELGSLKLFFGGREIKYENSIANNLIQNEMVIQAFIKTKIETIEDN